MRSLSLHLVVRSDTLISNSKQFFFSHDIVIYIIIECAAEEERSSHSTPPRKRLKSRDSNMSSVDFVEDTSTTESEYGVGQSCFSFDSNDSLNEPGSPQASLSAVKIKQS